MPLCRATTSCSLTRSISTSPPPRPTPRASIASRLAVTRGLGDVTRGGQFAAVEVADDLAALVDQADVGHEHRLVDDRSAAAFVPDDRFDGSQGIVGLLAKRAAAAGDRGGEHVADVVQVDDRIPDALVGRLAHRVSGHSLYPSILVS